MQTTDWRVAAAGIPVWEGAQVVLEGGGRGRVAKLRATHPIIAEVVPAYGAGERGEQFADELIPDLSHDGTLADYLPRLAEKLASAKVWDMTVEPNGDEWVLHGRTDLMMRWMQGLQVRTPDKLVALALAWPKDARRL